MDKINWDRILLASEMKRDYSIFSKVIFNEDVAPFQREWIEASIKHKRLLIIAPFGHAKTNNLAIKYPLWRLIKNPDLAVIIGGVTTKRAIEKTQAIATHIVQNEKLHEHFPHIQPDYERGWTDSRFFIKRKSIKKEASVTAIGTGDASVGLRGDLMILDDGVDPECRYSELQREKELSWFNSVFISRLTPNGEVIVNGTRWHEEDLYNSLSNNPEFKTIAYKAIQDDGSALWPSVWPIERLNQRKREIGEIAFELGYQNNPKVIIGQFFKWEWVKFYDKLPDSPHNKWILSIDLAISKKTTADYFVIAQLLYDDKNIYVDGFFRDRLNFPEALKKVKEYDAIYKPFAIPIEAVAYQSALPEQLTDTTFIKAIPLQCPETSKQQRLEGLMAYVQSGKILFAKNIPDAFKKEFLEFSPLGTHKHDDMLDALEIGVRYINQNLHNHYGDIAVAGRPDEVFRKYSNQNVWGGVNL